MSVVLPLHNAQEFLDSALAQLQALDSTVQYQFVVIDDHSTDSTFETIQGWDVHLGDHMVVERAVRRGVAEARNQALLHCTGEFVWFVDADDHWDGAIVRDMLAAAGTADLVVSNARKIALDSTSRGEIVDAERSEVISGAEAFTRLLEGTLQGHLWNKLFRRTALPPGIFPTTRAHSDLGALLEVLPSFGAVSLVPVSHYTYVLRSGSILNSPDYKWQDLGACFATAQRVAESIPGPRVERALLRFKYRNLVVPFANELSRRRDSISEEDLRSLRRQNKSRARLSDTLRVGLLSPLAVQVAMIRIFPSLYELLYRRNRSDRWTPIT